MKSHLLISVMTLLFSANLVALETISKDQLITLCHSENAVKQAECSAYVNGFLDGAFATDPRVASNVASEIGRMDSFSERALRTRLGRNHSRHGPSYYAGFCVPNEAPLTLILELIEGGPPSSNAEPAGGNARIFLYELLENNFPCDK